MQTGIYQIRNKINDKIYIGSSSNIRPRFNTHKSKLRRNLHENPHLQSAWNIYEENNFEFEFILECDPTTTLWYEQQFLDQWKPEYNICKFAHKPNPIKYTQEMRNRVSKQWRGVKKSKETRKKMSISRKGWTPTQEVRENMRLSHLGKKFSKETKEKMSKARCKKIYYLISPNGDLYIIDNLTKFCKDNILDNSNMSRVVRGIQKYHKGWEGDILWNL